jgi:hypothetical protein
VRVGDRSSRVLDGAESRAAAVNRLAGPFTCVRRACRAYPLVATRWKNGFYVSLASIFSLFILIDATVLHVTANMRQQAFDTMMRYRIIVPPPDKDIVIVDVDEASLAAIAPLVHVAKDDSRIGLLFKTHRHPDDRLTQLGEAVGDRLNGIKGQTLEKRYYRLEP